jgi:hypothetical protein
MFSYALNVNKIIPFYPFCYTVLSIHWDSMNMVQSNSVVVNVSSTSPPETYTCYEPKCVKKITKLGEYTICVGEPYTSDTPCIPGVNDTPKAACKGVHCSGRSPEVVY